MMGKMSSCHTVGLILTRSECKCKDMWYIIVGRRDPRETAATQCRAWHHRMSHVMARRQQEQQQQQQEEERTCASSQALVVRAAALICVVEPDLIVTTLCDVSHPRQSLVS